MLYMLDIKLITFRLRKNTSPVKIDILLFIDILDVYIRLSHFYRCLLIPYFVIG